MTNIVEALKSFAFDGDGPYRPWHMLRLKDRNEAAEKHLERFFDATMDEVRLWHASQYGCEVLALTHLPDYDHFRRGSMRREVSGEIAYPKHRDHSGHTLYGGGVAGIDARRIRGDWGKGPGSWRL